MEIMNTGGTGGTEAAIVDAAPTQDPDTSVDASGDTGGQSQADLDQEEEFELVVNGNTEKLKKSELLKRASEATGAQKRFQEAAEIRKAAEEERALAAKLFDLLKKDPLAVRKHLDKEFDDKAFLQSRLAEIMEEELLSPQEREHRQMIAELNALKEEKAAAQRAKDEEEINAKTQEERARLETVVSESLKAVGLPSSANAKQRLVQYIIEANQNDLDIPIETLAKQVKDDMKADLAELLQDADDVSFEEFLGSNLLTKAQKVGLAKIKRPGNPVPSRKTEQAEPSSKEVNPFEVRRKLLADHGIF